MFIIIVLLIIIMHIVIGEASNKCVHKSGLSTGNYIKQSPSRQPFFIFPFHSDVGQIWHHGVMMIVLHQKVEDQYSNFKTLLSAQSI